MNPLQHRRMRRLVEVYADGEADAVTARRVGTHLSQCRSCQDLADWLAATRQALRRRLPHGVTPRGAAPGRGGPHPRRGPARGPS
ncbi:MAG: zf-HC2 domain-containing protein [Acidobacteriota bacterium]|nr:zf-HC2 domain-containing protein [Acidobacteriota bacterium]